MTEEEILKQQLQELQEEGFNPFVVDEVFEEPVMVYIKGTPMSFLLNTDINVLH